MEMPPRKRPAALRALHHSKAAGDFTGELAALAANGVSTKRCAHSRTATLCASLSAIADELACPASRTCWCGVALCERPAACGVEASHWDAAVGKKPLPNRAGPHSSSAAQRGFTRFSA
ncbi:hypothetical protein [Halomonas sp. AOP42-B2-16]|uniref:hypothetical protein n=1 Tax=Halomonas sp. AOP42-B2-16 TaxID=3457673 RepID=UPI0040343AC8